MYFLSKLTFRLYHALEKILIKFFQGHKLNDSPENELGKSLFVPGKPNLLQVVMAGEWLSTSGL